MTADTIRLTFPDGTVQEVPRGTTLETLSTLHPENGSPVMLGLVDEKLRELNHPLTRDGAVRFLTLESVDGRRTYTRTLYFLLIHSVETLYGDAAHVRIKHSVTGGTYFEIDIHGTEGVTRSQVREIRARMQDLIDRDLPITKERYSLEEAMDYFADKGMQDKVRALRYRRFSVVNLYSLESSKDYFYGYMLPHTGMIFAFDICPYEKGIVLLLPSEKAPHQVQAFHPSSKLFSVYSRSAEWSRILGVENIGALNDCIARGGIRELVEVSEALHAGHIAQIARDIASREDTRIVLIAGPSSSGKTTFARKLNIQLQSEGLKPRLISVDDYFLNREQTPLGPDGKPDFECLEAIDVPLFNADLTALLEGKSITMPKFNFVTGKREYHKHPLCLGEDGILIIEGIHCLNEKLTADIPRNEKYKIYISALTLINVDDHNRIPTTDGRLLRRMVRDHQYRGTSAAGTIAMWPSVRAGEDRNIFPYQEEADVMFNSAHIYELAILKQYAEPLLFGIERGEPEYNEARRLIKFLDYCLGVSSEIVPGGSIIREFIGGSTFES